MEQEPKQPASLPDNAYRELAPGEKYSPVMPASSKPKEVTVYSVVFGIVMAIVFSAAAAYLGLRVGQVFEAAIPIAIIAVGVGNLTGRSGMLGQNVIIQSIGSSSGVIVAGAIFTLPALYILGLEAHFYQIFLSSLFGGLLGILLLIPFRKYFVKDMHGKYPFPEATATTEGARLRREEGRSGQAVGLQRSDRRTVRLCRSARSAGGPRTSRRVWPSGERCWPIRRSWSSRSIPEPPCSVWAISSGSAMPRYLRRFVYRMVRTDSVHQPFRRRTDGRRRRGRDRVAPRHVARGDFPELRAPYRDRGHRDGRRGRYHPFVEDHPPGAVAGRDRAAGRQTPGTRPAARNATCR